MAAEDAPPITIEITSPESEAVTLEAREVIVPGRGGLFSVRPGHTPLLSTLTSGVLAIDILDGDHVFFAVHGGFAEVIDNMVRILTPRFERGGDIDAERAREAQERAEQRLSRKDSDDDVARAEAALHRAMARLGAHHGETI